jgi:hypothetical protein
MNPGCGRVESLEIDLTDGADQSASQRRPDLPPKKRFVVLERSWRDSRFDYGCEPLVEQLVETHDRGTGHAAVVAQLQLQIQKLLRLAVWTMDAYS